MSGFRTSFIYFVRPVGAPGPVKIGCSESPEKRLETLMTWSPMPLEIAATVPGSFDLERNIHQCFADLYSHREWFFADDRITTVIERLRAGAAITEAMDLTDRRGRLPRKNQGGSGWTPEVRKYMGLFHRLRHARLRAEKLVGKYLLLSDDCDRALDRVRKGRETPADIELMEAAIADPVKHCVVNPYRIAA